MTIRRVRAGAWQVVDPYRAVLSQHQNVASAMFWAVLFALTRNEPLGKDTVKWD